MRPYTRPLGRTRGFTLVEVVFAISILTIGALMLSVSLASSERLNSLARERAVANNVIRSYLERMRRSYPRNASDANMIELTMRSLTTSSGNGTSNFTDGSSIPDSTPIFDLQKLYASGMVERGVLRSATARVFFLTDERSNAGGGNWGGALTATITNPTAVSSITTSTTTPDTSTFPGVTVNNHLTDSDSTALGLPRDLNANGTSTETDTVNYNSTSAIVLVPMKVQLLWLSGSLGGLNSNGKPMWQKLTVYALLSPQH